MTVAREGVARDASGRVDAVVTAVLAFAAFAWLAQARLVDDDEGYYALAGRALLDGLVPYRDFFFPQMPGTAALYGVARALLGPGLVPLRWVTALAAAGTTVLVHRAAVTLEGRVAGALAAVLFVAHTLTWEWATTVKTFPPALLLGTAALVVSSRRPATPRRAFSAGVLAGLAVTSRLLSVPVVLGAAVAVVTAAPPGSDRRRSVAGGAAGLALGLAPAAALIALDPAAFWFDNVTYHALRSPGSGLVKDLPQKLGVLAEVWLTPLGASRPDVTGLQSLALLALCALGATRRGEPGAPGDASATPYVVAVLATVVVSVLPSPAWSQYFAAAVPAASVLAGRATAGVSSARGRAAIALAALTYVALAVPSLVDRVARAPAPLRPAAVDAVGRALDAVTRPDERVAAHWPSYLVASSRVPIPEARNQFARLYSDGLPAEARRRFGLSTEEELRGALLGGAAAAFVVGAYTVPETALALRDAGFRRVAELPGAYVWGRDRRIR